VELETLKIENPKQSLEGINYEQQIRTLKKEIADLRKENTSLMNEQMEQLKFQLKEPEPINEEELKWRDSKIESLENENFELR